MCYYAILESEHMGLQGGVQEVAQSYMLRNLKLDIWALTICSKDKKWSPKQANKSGFCTLHSIPWDHT